MARPFVYRSPRHLDTIPKNWHPLPLTPATKKALMEGYSHYQNFSYDEKKGFVVEVPVPPGHGKVPRASIAALKNHVETAIKLTRGGNLATNQPGRPLDECYSWWLGQLIHYGLRLELSADEAKLVVKSAMVQGHLKVPEHLRKMEQRMRTAANRRAKKRGYRLAALQATPEDRRGKMKQESDTSEDDSDDDSVQTPTSRRRRQSRLKVEDDTSSSVGDTDVEHGQASDSTDSDTDLGTIRKVPPPTLATSKSRAPAGTIATSGKPQTKQAAKASAANLPKGSTNDSSDASSSGSDSDSSHDEDIQHNGFPIKQDTDTFDTDSDSDGSDYPDTKVTESKSVGKSSDESSSDEDASDVGSLSDDSEYERAVLAHSQTVDGASAQYGDTDSSSASSSDDEAQSRSASKTTNGKMQSTQSASKGSISKPKRASTIKQLVKSAPKPLEIKRDRKPRPEELERSSARDLTPTPAVNIQPRHHVTVATATPSKKATVTAPTDQTQKIKLSARQKSKLPAVPEEVQSRVVAKRRAEIDGAGLGDDTKRQKRVGAAADANLSANVLHDMTPRTGSQKELRSGQTASSSSTRKNSSSSSAIPTAKSSRAARHDAFALSDSDENVVVKRQPKLEQGAPSPRKRPSMISDEMHGSQINLLSSEDDNSSAESAGPLEIVEAKPKTKSGRTEKVSPAPKRSGTSSRAISVEIPSSGSKARVAQLREEESFPSSPPGVPPLKGILKSSPSFRPRDNYPYPSKALNSSGHSRTRDDSPQLPVQPPQKHRSSVPPPRLSSSYTTESGWQALNPNSKSKMRPSGQIEEVAQPEARRNLFAQLSERDRAAVGESRQNGGGFPRGKVINPSFSNSTSSKKKPRVPGF